MFTGLVSDVGTIESAAPGASGGRTVAICTSWDLSDIALGESIAVDGACLTVTKVERGAFFIDASPETLERTTLGERRVGDRVHLERALAVGDRLGGHFVLGHVDGVGRVIERSKAENSWLLTFEAPETVAPYLIEKGSIAVDGVSLTVNEVNGDRFGVAIIPFTAEKTNLGAYESGRRVNLEADMVGKYVRKFVVPQSSLPGGSSDDR